MKTCLLCGTPAPDDTATCPNDGEASWSGEADRAPVTPVVVVEADEAERDVSDAPETPARKRSRR